MVEQLFGTDKIISKNAGLITPQKAFENAKAIGIYFSAHWCPPCRAFTPLLGAATEEASNSEFAMIFASFDQDEKQFKEYVHSMPENWFAFSITDQRRETLSQTFAVSGIPRLVIINAKTGAIIEGNARNDISSKGPEAINEYVAKAQ